MLMKDWRGVSYSGGRLVLQGVKQDVMSRQKRLCESFLCRIWERMVEESVMLGKCSIPAALFIEWPEVFCRHKWMAPAWGFCINPVNEVQAAVLAKNENMITAAQTTAEYCGEDFETLVDERAAERELEREKKVIPPATTAIENKAASTPVTSPKVMAGKAAA